MNENSFNNNNNNNSITAYMNGENFDPIALAVENKLKQKLAQLQAKRKTQLQNYL